MPKLKILLLSIAFISWVPTKAQVAIDVSEGGYFINSQKIEYPTASYTLTDILGKDYRVFAGVNTVYDQLGLRLYVPPGSDLVKSLYIDFTTGSYRFSPKQTFGGKVKINGYEIDKSFTRDSLGNIPNLFFDLNGSMKFGYSAVTFNNVTLFFRFNEDRSIETLSIGFSDTLGDFRTKAQRSDAHSTLINLDFKYERGVTNSDGKKTGIWEYYDQPAELALRYDHDTDSILYLKKIDTDFVILDGAKWSHAKLDIYSRAIASDREFFSALGRLIRYPELARNQMIMGRVYVSFVIDKTGNMQDVKVEKDIGAGCGMAVANALASSKFSWTHAVKNNNGYDSRFTMPVTFVLGSENNMPVIPPDENLSLPEARMLPELDIIAWGIPPPH